MAIQETPRMGALLNEIGRLESNNQPNVVYGNNTFNDYSDHPRQYVRVQSGPNQDLKTSAAGEFQFIADTWDRYQKKLNLPDFSPESQRIAAAELARDDYRKRTGRNLDADLESNDPEIQQGIFENLKDTWSSLPGGVEDQKDPQLFANVFKAQTGEKPTSIADDAFSFFMQSAQANPDNPYNYVIGAASGIFKDDSLYDRVIYEASKIPAEVPTPAPATFGEMYSRGVDETAIGMSADMQYFKSIVNSLVLDDEESAVRNIEQAQYLESKLAQAGPAAQSLEDFVNEPTLTGAVDKIAYTLGSVAPMATTTLAGFLTGGITAVLGKEALTATSQAVMKKYFADKIQDKAEGKALSEVDDQLTEAAFQAANGRLTGSKSLFSARNIGMGVGGFSASYPFAAGTSLGEFEEAGVALTDEKKRMAAMLGFPIALLDVAGEALILGLLAKASKKAISENTSSNVLKRFAADVSKAAGKSGLIEAPIEGLQEGINIAQRLYYDDKYTSRQAWLRAGEAIFGGFVGGAGMGTIGGGVASAANIVQNPIAQQAQKMLDSVAKNEVSAEIDSTAAGVSDQNILTGTPIPESPDTIQSQLEAMIDSRSSKKAVWIPDGTRTLDQIEQKVPIGGGPVQINLGGRIGEVWAANTTDPFPLNEDHENGIIVSKNKAIVEKIDKDPTEVNVGAAIGIPTAEDGIGRAAAEAGTVVISGKDEKGEPISEYTIDANTDAATTQEYINRTRGQVPNGTVELTTEDKVRRDRARAADFTAEDNLLARYEALTEEQKNKLEEATGLSRSEGELIDAILNDEKFDNRLERMITLIDEIDVIKADKKRVLGSVDFLLRKQESPETASMELDSEVDPRTLALDTLQELADKDSKNKAILSPLIAKLENNKIESKNIPLEVQKVLEENPEIADEVRDVFAGLENRAETDAKIRNFLEREIQGFQQREEPLTKYAAQPLPTTNRLDLKSRGQISEKEEAEYVESFNELLHLVIDKHVKFSGRKNISREDHRAKLSENEITLMNSIDFKDADHRLRAIFIDRIDDVSKEETFSRDMFAAQKELDFLKTQFNSFSTNTVKDLVTAYKASKDNNFDFDFVITEIGGNLFLNKKSTDAVYFNEVKTKNRQTGETNVITVREATSNLVINMLEQADNFLIDGNTKKAIGVSPAAQSTFVLIGPEKDTTLQADTGKKKYFPEGSNNRKKVTLGTLIQLGKDINITSKNSLLGTSLNSYAANRLAFQTALITLDERGYSIGMQLPVDVTKTTIDGEPNRINITGVNNKTEYNLEIQEDDKGTFVIADGTRIQLSKNGKKETSLDFDPTKSDNINAKIITSASEPINLLGFLSENIADNLAKHRVAKVAVRYDQKTNKANYYYSGTQDLIGFDFIKEDTPKNGSSFIARIEPKLQKSKQKGFVFHKNKVTPLGKDIGIGTSDLLTILETSLTYTDKSQRGFTIADIFYSVNPYPEVSKKPNDYLWRQYSIAMSYKRLRGEIKDLDQETEGYKEKIDQLELYEGYFQQASINKNKSIPQEEIPDWFINHSTEEYKNSIEEQRDESLSKEFPLATHAEKADVTLMEDIDVAKINSEGGNEILTKEEQEERLIDYDEYIVSTSLQRGYLQEFEKSNFLPQRRKRENARNRVLKNIRSNLAQKTRGAAISESLAGRTSDAFKDFVNLAYNKILNLQIPVTIVGLSDLQKDQQQGYNKYKNLFPATSELYVQTVEEKFAIITEQMEKMQKVFIAEFNKAKTKKEKEALKENWKMFELKYEAVADAFTKGKVDKGAPFLKLAKEIKPSKLRNLQNEIEKREIEVVTLATKAKKELEAQKNLETKREALQKKYSKWNEKNSDDAKNYIAEMQKVIKTRDLAKDKAKDKYEKKILTKEEKNQIDIKVKKELLNRGTELLLSKKADESVKNFSQELQAIAQTQLANLEREIDVKIDTVSKQKLDEILGKFERSENLDRKHKGEILFVDRTAFIILNDTGSVNQTELSSYLAHELGHTFVRETWHDLTNRMVQRDKIAVKTFKLLYTDYMKATFKDGSYQFNEATNKFEPVGKGYVRLEGSPRQYGNKNNKMEPSNGSEKYIGFQEYLADQVALYISDPETKIQNISGKWLKNISEKLMKLFEGVKNFFLTQRTKPFKETQAYIRTILSDPKKRELSARYYKDETIDIGQSLELGTIQEQVKNASRPVGNLIKRMSERFFKSDTLKTTAKFLAATDNWYRTLGDAGIELGQFFHGKTQSKERPGFHHTSRTKEIQFTNQVETILNSYLKDGDEWRTPDLQLLFSIIENEDISTENFETQFQDKALAAKAKRVRDFLAYIHKSYISPVKGMQTRFRKNFFPRGLDIALLSQSTEEGELARSRLFKILTDEKINKNAITEEEAEAFIKSIIENPFEQPGDIANIYERVRSKALDAISTPVLRENGLLVDPQQALLSYFHFITRKVELERRGGKAKLDEILDNIVKETYENPDKIVNFTNTQTGELDKRALTEAQDKLRTVLQDSINKQFGRIEPLPSWMRTFNSVSAVITTFTTLLFAMLSSFPDLGSIGVRMKSFANLKTGLSELFNSDMSYDMKVDFARALGVANFDGLEVAWLSAGEMDYANKWARTWMKNWFKYTLLSSWTRFTRVMASSMGRSYILQLAKVLDPNSTYSQKDKEQAQRWLEEFPDLTLEDINTWNAGNPNADNGFGFVSKDAKRAEAGEKVRAAIAQFVDESIIRPNPAHRPNLANNPWLSVVFQLKQFFYSYGKVVIGGLGREIKNRYSEDGHFGGGAMLILLAASTMLPLAAIGVELKELTKYMLQLIAAPIIPNEALGVREASAQTFRSDYTPWGRYSFEMFEKTGMLGPLSIGVMAASSHRWGDNPVVASVPIADALWDSFGKGEWVRLIPILNNIR